MARRVAWTESAWQQLECAADYIARDSPRYVAASVDEARSVAGSLRTFPIRERVVPEMSEDAVREVFVENYRLIYEVRKQSVIILAFLHGARRFPSELT